MGQLARDVLWVAVVLGIPASAVALAWTGLDVVRWVRSRGARPDSSPAGTSGSDGSGATPPPASMRRGGER